MGMLKEFKDFAMKGNVMDMAIGVIIGAAFSPIVKSMVKDIIMPPIGILMGKVDFSKLNYVVQEGTDAVAAIGDGKAVAAVDAVTINYGIFINNIISFLITAFCVFMIVKVMNSAKKKEEPKAATTHECPKCMSTISLKATRCPNCTSEVTA
ncbi:MAG: large conductance mechanosensitive channel [Planctomycetota bacterium]|jgi:large conductance mechanosensitive channel